MSVKMMTTDQIHTNLATIHNMWPGGVPTEQYDQVNALKAELKRRGIDAKVQAPHMPETKPLQDMDVDQLTKELGDISKAIGKDPSDEALQERFANVRFELRQRTKNAPVVQAANPQTGETFMQELTKPTNGSNGSFQDGAVSRHTTEMPSAAAQQAQQAAQVQRMQDMEQLVRKHNLAKIAAECASNILAKHGDPNGDDIENACTIGMKIAQNIFDKVGL